MFPPSLSGHGQSSSEASPVRLGRGARSCSTLPRSGGVAPCAVHAPRLRWGVWPRSTAVRTATSPPPFSRRKPQDVAPLRVEHKLAHSLCLAFNGSLWPRRCLLRPSAPRCGLPSAAGGPRPPPAPSLQRSTCRALPRQRELLPRVSQALLT
ncbi:uncharacterized protein Tco025E_09689 [Trypanosoma conorhini]|uniref:Uncharacterized protein n=1 Tax=Trypanosoma conorhini TaxID=83891 RepID=A0A3R7M5P2_9TRYP|nr:uncharacterized protein Tco025E_09689 [Trypanosoma conorhini]RNE96617.1 hypothetical protein Tco025E_09689 [Trypanosoma conorhini]